MVLHFKVNKPPAFVYSYLSDMQKFVSVHPVIFKIENIRDNHYLMHETLKFAFVPLTFTYPAHIEASASGNSVLMKARVMKVTQIELMFNIREDKDGCSVEEQVTFKSWLPVKYLMASIFRKQHARLFRNLDAL